MPNRVSPGDPDLIWIQEAETTYQRSRKFLDGLINQGRISYVTFEGDKKLYLLRSQLDAVLAGQVQRRGDDDDGTQVS